MKPTTGDLHRTGLAEGQNAGGDGSCFDASGRFYISSANMIPQPSLNLPIRLLAFAAGILAAQTVSAQGLPSATLPEAGTKLSEHVYEITGFPNIGIVVGSRATLVVDNGLGTPNGQTIMRVVRKIGDRPALYLTNTHFHPEHAGGDGGFPANTILIRSSVQQQEMAENGANMLARFGGINKEFGELKGATLRPPDVIFDKEVKLDLGGVTARILWFGEAHTKGDQLVFVEPDSVLISGDVVQNKVVLALPGNSGSLASWLGVLDQVEALKPRIVMPTHSAVGDGSLIAENKAFLIDMRNRIAGFKRQGVPVAETTQRITEYFKSAYPEWAKPEWNRLNALPGFIQRVYAQVQ